MSSFNGRLTRLEQKTGPTDTIIMWQDLQDRERFHSGGREYREGADNWPDETKNKIVRVVWVDDWKAL